jgi:hypothetical protein
VTKTLKALGKEGLYLNITKNIEEKLRRNLILKNGKLFF